MKFDELLVNIEALDSAGVREIDEKKRIIEQLIIKFAVPLNPAEEGIFEKKYLARAKAKILMMFLNTYEKHFKLKDDLAQFMRVFKNMLESEEDYPNRDMDYLINMSDTLARKLLAVRNLLETGAEKAKDLYKLSRDRTYKEALADYLLLSVPFQDALKDFNRLTDGYRTSKIFGPDVEKLIHMKIQYWAGKYEPASQIYNNYLLLKKGLSKIEELEIQY